MDICRKTDLKKDIMVEDEMIYMSASADYADKVCSSTDNVEYNDSIRKAFIAGSEYAIREAYEIQTTENFHTRYIIL